MRIPLLYSFTILGKGILDGRRGHPDESHSSEHPLAPDSDPDAPKTARLGFYEQVLVYLVDAERDVIRKQYQKVQKGLHGRLQAVRWELAALKEADSKLAADHRAKNFEEPHVAVSRAKYVTLMSIAGVAEASFAAAALMILRVSQEERYVIALGPSVFTLVAAHLLGQMIAQTPLPETRRVSRKLAACTAIICLIAALGSMAILRQEFLAYSGKTTTVWTTAGLFLLNIVFLAGGTLLSFMAHHHDAELARIWMQRRNLSIQIKRVWSRWTALSGRFDRALALVREDDFRALDRGKAGLAEYRQGVAMGLREGRKVPSWFKDGISDRLFAARPVLDVELDAAPPPLDEVLRPLSPPSSVLEDSSGNHAPGPVSNVSLPDRLGRNGASPAVKFPTN